MDIKGFRTLNGVVEKVAEELGSEFLVQPEPSADAGERVPIVQIRFHNTPTVFKNGHAAITRALQEAGLYNDVDDEIEPDGDGPRLMSNGAISLGGVLAFEFIDMNEPGTKLMRFMLTH